MTATRPWAARGAILAWATLVGCGVFSGGLLAEDGAQDRVVLARALPPMDGRGLEVTVVEVGYAPGGASAPHRHPCPVIGYVLEGVLRSGVEGEPEATYRAGETYEAPGGVHLVSANASREEPVRFLAYFTCDHETPLVVPASGSPTPGNR